VCEQGHNKIKHVECHKCIEQERELLFQKRMAKMQKQEEKEFIETVIGLSELAITMNIPKEIVGVICIFLPAGKRLLKSRDGTGQNIYNIFLQRQEIRDRVSLCNSTNEYGTYTSMEEFNYAQKLFKEKEEAQGCVIL